MRAALPRPAQAGPGLGSGGNTSRSRPPPWPAPVRQLAWLSTRRLLPCSSTSATRAGSSVIGTCPQPRSGRNLACGKAALATRTWRGGGSPALVPPARAARGFARPPPPELGVFARAGAPGGRGGREAAPSPPPPPPPPPAP